MAVISALVASFTAAAATVGTFLAGQTVGALLARTVIMGLVSVALNRTIAKGNQKTGVDPGARFQLAPQTNHKIPVLFGEAQFGGIITDGVLTNDNKTMSVALTLTEETGPLLSTGAISSYTFKEAYIDGRRVYFTTDGVTVDYTQDAEGVIDSSMSGLMRVYMYSGDAQATSQIAPANDSITGGGAATEFVQQAASAVFGSGTEWTSTNNMTDLIFAIVKVDYNRDKNVTSIGDWQFRVANSMTQPGDCMFDYITNTRYGAGVPLTDIVSSDEDLATLVSRLNLSTYPWVNILPGGSRYTL
jgi:hypothetical protein